MIALSLLLFSLLAAALFLRPVRFTAHATFRDADPSTAEFSPTTGLLQLGGVEEEEHSRVSRAPVIMNSRIVLEPLIQRLHLQGSIEPLQQGSFLWARSVFDKITTRIVQNFLAEKARFAIPGSIVIPPITGSVFCTNIVYEGSLLQQYVISFTDQEQYEVWQHGVMLGTGKVGDVFQTGQASFVLRLAKRQALSQKKFVLQLIPVDALSEWLAQEIKIEVDSEDDQLFKIFYTGRDRELVAGVINAQMDCYKEYLEKDSREKMQKQLGYLEQRRKDVLAEMEVFLEERKDALQKKDLAAEGVTKEAVLFEGEKYLDYKTQEEMLAKRRERYVQDLIAMSQKLHALQSYKVHGHPLISELQSSLQGLSGMMQKKRQIAEKRDSLRLQLAESAERGAVPFEKKEFLANLEGEAKKLLETLNTVHSLSLLQKNPTNQAVELGGAARLSSISKRALVEWLHAPGAIGEDFTGFDLPFAEKLYRQASERLDLARKNVDQWAWVLESIQGKNFSLSTLSGRLEDEISKSLIEDAAEAAIKLSYQSHYTTKELNHFQHFLEQQEKLLSFHAEEKMEQWIEEEITWEERVSDLQLALVFLLNQEMAVVQEGIGDIVSEEIEATKRKQATLTEKLAKLDQQIQGLPEVWALQRKTELKAGMFESMTESLNEMVEAMSLAYHMQMVNAGPIERAQVPFRPVGRSLSKTLLAGSFVSVFFASMIVIVVSLCKGFVATGYNLSALGAMWVGSFYQKDGGIRQDHVRHALQVIEERVEEENMGAITVAVVAGNKDCLVNQMAECLVALQDRVLVIEMPDEKESLEQCGFIDFLSGLTNHPKIQRRKGVDFITAGGADKQFLQYFLTEKYQMFLQKTRYQYDWIFFFCKKGLEDAVCRQVAREAEAVVVGIEQDRLSVIWPWVAESSLGKPVVFGQV